MPGQQRLVRERAHDEPELAEARERVGCGQAAEHVVACDRIHRHPRRAQALCEPVALGERACHALAHLRLLRAGDLADRCRPRGERAGRPQRVERTGQGGLRDRVADARGAQPEALGERAADDQVVVLGHER